MKTFKITLLAGSIDRSICPPPIIQVLFPSFDGWPVRFTEEGCFVDVPDGHHPVDLGPLVKVEPLS